MIPLADHQGGAPREEPVRGLPFAGASTVVSNPAAGRAFATFLTAAARDDGSQLANVAPVSEVADETSLTGTVTATPPPPTAAPAKALGARSDTVGHDAVEEADVTHMSRIATASRDDGRDIGHASAVLDDALPKPRSATVHDAKETDVIAHRDPAPSRSSGNGTGHGGGGFATMPSAIAPASGEPISVVAEPGARPMDGAPLSDDQRPGSAQIGASGPRLFGASGVVPGLADMADEGLVVPARHRVPAAASAATAPRGLPPPLSERSTGPLAAAAIAAQAATPPPPPATTSSAAAALMPIMTVLKMPEPVAAASGRSATPATSGPRVASPVPARLPTLAVAPPQAGFSTALADVMMAVSDPVDLVDPALGAPEQRASALPVITSASPLAPATPGQDIPRQIAIQIAQAAEGGPGGTRGTVELSLSPEELGRVRLRLHPSEAGLSVTITADRPETLDLMRRNIDLLAREFLDIGYEGAQFDFAQSGQGTDDGQSAPPEGANPARNAERAATAQPERSGRLMLGDQLDIRL